MTDTTTARTPSLEELTVCFEGAIPAVVATAAADGTPNVTFLSRVRMVDDERIALSNQFFSKTTRNLAENPQASVLLTDPVSYRQYRLALTYERTERRGPIFELLHDDVAAVAAIYGMQDVFKLRGADIYRVLHIEEVAGARPNEPDPARQEESATRVDIGLLAELELPPEPLRRISTRLSIATVDCLAELFGYQHISAAALGRGGHPALHNRQSRLRNRRRRLGDPAGRGSHRHGRRSMHPDPPRQRRPTDQIRPEPSDTPTSERGDIGPGHQIPFPGLHRHPKPDGGASHGPRRTSRGARGREHEAGGLHLR